SSRRRHTRSYGDWSSDVCSSDLAGSGGRHAGAGCAADEREGAAGDTRMVGRPKIGVLALQGDVEKHSQAVKRGGGEPVEVRSAQDRKSVVEGKSVEGGGRGMLE